MIETKADLHAAYDAIHDEAVDRAGGLADLDVRARQYVELYSLSGGNHCFPLIAAHGALWARNYFRFGLRLGSIVSRFSSVRQKKHLYHVSELEKLADAFREVNRLVFTETYTMFHFTHRFGREYGSERVVPSNLLARLNECHAARRTNAELTTLQKRELFRVFFLHEQENIVGPKITAAIDELNWSLIKPIVLRPRVRFAYQRKAMSFRDFCNENERVSRGLQAFDNAVQHGFDRVLERLNDYAL